MKITRQTKTTLTLLHVPSNTLAVACVSGVIAFVILFSVASEFDAQWIMALIPISVIAILSLQFRVGTRASFDTETQTAWIRQNSWLGSHKTAYDISPPCRIVVEKGLREIKDNNGKIERIAVVTRMKLHIPSGQSEGSFPLQTEFTETPDHYEVAERINDWLDSPAPRS